MDRIDDKLWSWASDLEAGTAAQAARTARLPIVHGHVALMPDAHLGIGATVGSVIPTEGAIIPSDALIDEIPASYKDIDQVMADQADLVRVEHTLTQVLNYKGT